MTNGGVGEPRRHGFILCCRLDGRGVRARLFVELESCWRDSIGAMANLAALLQDREYIPIKGRSLRSGVCRSLVSL